MSDTIYLDDSDIQNLYSKEDCIDELLEISKLGPVSRDSFRQISEIPEKYWKKYFGTWTEFKRQAGLASNRTETQYFNQVAKHAAKDSNIWLTEEKRKWEGNWSKPYSARWQSALVGSDMHDLNCDPFYRRTFVDTAYRLEPERIVLAGDIFDFPEFSKYTTDPREFKIVERILWVHDFLKDLREASPRSQIDFVEGNHEFRLLRQLSESSPAVQAILSGIHGMDVKGLLGLDKFEIKFYARADLKAFTETNIKSEYSRNYVNINDQVIFHHFPEGKKYGMPGAHGHHHKHTVDSYFSPVYGAYEWHQLGSGHKRHASYTNGEKWANGFLIAHMDTVKRRTQLEYLDVTNDHAFIGGNFYERNEEEQNFSV